MSATVVASVALLITILRSISMVYLIAGSSFGALVTLLLAAFPREWCP